LFPSELKSLPLANIIRPMIEHKLEKRGFLTQVMKNLHQIPTRLIPSIPPIMDKIPSHQETEKKKQMLAHPHSVTLKQQNDIDIIHNFIILFRLRKNLISFPNLKRRSLMMMKKAITSKILMI
jgi:hypothetical protein